MYRLHSLASISRMNFKRLQLLSIQASSSLPLAADRPCIPLCRPCRPRTRIQMGCGALSTQTRRKAGRAQALDHDHPEPGTPEAPPQVPVSLDKVPGTGVPVEEVIPSTPHASSPVQPIVPSLSPAVPSTGSRTLREGAQLDVIATPDAGNPVVARESGSGDLSGPDGAAVADIAATVQPLMDQVAGMATATEAQLFMQNWDTLEAWMRQKGYFDFAAEGPAVSELGAIKKACNDVARARPEAIYDLDQGVLNSWVTAYQNLRSLDAGAAALGDRKAKNAMDRLRPYVAGQKPLGVGAGGPATFQDIMRVLFAQRVDTHHPERAMKMKQEFVIDGAAVVSSALSVLQKDPSLQSTARLAEAQASAAAERESIAAQRQQRDIARGYGSQPDRGPNFRPGDWTCEVCSQHNFAKNHQCFKCQAARPVSAGPAPVKRNSWYAGEGSAPSFNGESPGSAELPPNFRPGDWICPGCSAHNFRSKSECFRCRQARPASAVLQQRSDQSNTYVAMAGDWTCAECGKQNFARRQDCFRCGSTRSDDVEVVGGDDGRRLGRSGRLSGADGSSTGGFGRRDGSFREPPVVRLGDWRCSECKAHNFARNRECFKCGSLASAGETMQPTDTARLPSRAPRGGYGDTRPPRASFSQAAPPQSADVDW